MFSFFKKSKEEEDNFDPTSITLKDLKKGFLVDYQGKSYEVTKEFEYDYGDNYFTVEFKLESATDSFHLSVDTNEEMELSISNQIEKRLISKRVFESLRADDSDPPDEFTVEGEIFYFEEEEAGFFHEIGKNDSEDEFISYIYESESGEFIEITLFSSMEIEVFRGKSAKESDFSQILPGK
jgi:hypothetical protein